MASGRKINDHLLHFLIAKCNQGLNEYLEWINFNIQIGESGKQEYISNVKLPKAIEWIERIYQFKIQLKESLTMLLIDLPTEIRNLILEIINQLDELDFLDNDLFKYRQQQEKYYAKLQELKKESREKFNKSNDLNSINEFSLETLNAVIKDLKSQLDFISKSLVINLNYLEFVLEQIKEKISNVINILKSSKSRLE
ncbi:hypothetical protein D8M03_15680 [Lysinibacillus endophyticus]|uniref:Uncharacterized protein n=1 Tax=Ureibacillus endophyticus TaxID=1978490 RepID=A0A494YTZ1_9BACL|nr:hypothetical protein D8M03_15680 [Lysinibacillus endophyticus]